MSGEMSSGISGQGSWKVHEVFWQLLYWPSQLLALFVLNGLSSSQTHEPSRETQLGMKSGSPHSRKKAGTRTKVSANTVRPRAKTKAFLRMSTHKTLLRSQARSVPYSTLFPYETTGLNHPYATFRAQWLKVKERVETGVSQMDPKTNEEERLSGAQLHGIYEAGTWASQEAQW